jgi:hypothetical protein
MANALKIHNYSPQELLDRAHVVQARHMSNIKESTDIDQIKLNISSYKQISPTYIKTLYGYQCWCGVVLKQKSEKKTSY